MAPISLKDRIRAAATVADLAALTVEAFGYKQASQNTRKKWSRAITAAKVRLAVAV